MAPAAQASATADEVGTQVQHVPTVANTPRDALEAPLPLPPPPPPPPPPDGDFERMLDAVGGFGRFQVRLLLLMQPPFMFYGLTYFSQVWLLLTPDHWCSVPALEERGWSAADVKNASAPLEWRGGVAAHSQCTMYDVDFSTVDLSAWSPGNDTPIVACRHGWAYDFSLTYPTIVSDNDWVCDGAWKLVLVSTLFFVGSMLGSTVFSWMADRFGRLPTLVAINFTCCVSGLLSAFATSLPTFAVARLVFGVGNNLQYVVAVTLMTEFVENRHRATVINVPLATTLCLTVTLLPWVAKAIHNWRYLAVAMALPMGLVPLYYVLDVPESCRWLQHTGQIARVVRQMKRIAAENGRQVPDQVWEEFSAAAQRRHEQQLTEKPPTLLDVMRLPRMRRRLLALTVGTMLTVLQFDLMARATEFDVDVYTAQSVLGAAEAPAELVTWLLVDTVGRRTTAIGAFASTSGTAVALAALLHRGGTPVVAVALAVLCRCSATVVMNVLLQLQVELVPTVVRGRLIGMMNVAGRLSIVISPAISQLKRVQRGLPALVVAAVALAGGAVFSTLPETMGHPLPDTLDEGELFGEGQRYWQCFWQRPCGGRTKAKADLDGCDNLAMDTIGEGASGSAEVTGAERL